MTTTAEKAAPEKRKALGRGLESLLPGGPRAVAPAAVSSPGAAATAVAGGAPAPHLPSLSETRDSVVQIALEQIEENPYQTRYHFGDQALEELASSIRANGVVQPVVVRPGADGRYTLILGERRCRASKLAGKTTIPAMVRRVSDQQAAEMTVVENLQRQDLNCIEQASAFSKLSRDFGLTQEQIGQRVGVSRESVSNYMRLLKLPAAVLQHLQEGRLGFSEARVLLQLLDPALIEKIADEAVRKHLSVAQLEELVDRTNIPLVKGETPQRARWVDPNVRAAQTEMERVLGMRVRIRDRKGKGKIVIEYATLEDFDRVVDMLKGG
ncbi:MAG TPA: ParB/RepB/Spo0J family partition protein [Terriglobales bacterium]|nr:ParB/RepB/Spo0J family partition protein [Terriglobales bacterium]